MIEFTQLINRSFGAPVYEEQPVTINPVFVVSYTPHETGTFIVLVNSKMTVTESYEEVKRILGEAT